MNALVSAARAAKPLDRRQRAAVSEGAIRRVAPALLQQPPREGESAVEFQARIQALLRDGVADDVARLTRDRNVCDALVFRAAKEGPPAPPAVEAIHRHLVHKEFGGPESQYIACGCPPDFRPWEWIDLDVDDEEAEPEDERDPDNWEVVVDVLTADGGRAMRLPVNRALRETGKYARRDVFGDAYVALFAENRVTASHVDLHPLHFVGAGFDWTARGIADLVPAARA